MSRILFNLNGHEDIADAICGQGQASIGAYARRRFPDGETYLRVDSPVRGADVILLCGLEQPDDKFLPLLFFGRSTIVSASLSSSAAIPKAIESEYLFA